MSNLGRVVRLHGKAAFVALGDGTEVECAVRGRLKQGKRTTRSPIAVGDVVELERESADLPWNIESISERHGILSRPSAHNPRLEQVVCVNVDQLVVTLGATGIDSQLKLLDRLVVAGASSHLDLLIVINKIDLIEEEYYDEEVALYRACGFRVLLTSATSGHGIADLAAALADRVSVFSGMSGVGKSSLLNAIQPGLGLRIGALSDATGGGRHTTTNVSLLTLDAGGFVVDTPGVREFGLWRITREELGLWYPDFHAYLPACRYKGCTHSHEPDCAVKAAVESGVLDDGRYERYLAIFSELS